MEKFLIKNKKEENGKSSSMNITPHIQQNPQNIHMINELNRNPQAFNSLHPVQQVSVANDLQKTYGNQNVQRLIKSQTTTKTNESPLQTKKENKTGLPDKIKENTENMSGLSLDNVRVHYNSAKPRELDALAYTQGTDIHIASGQEQHLPHEAWHVVQQMQGRVQATMQVQGVKINDDERLEKEADEIRGKSIQTVSEYPHNDVIQKRALVKSRDIIGNERFGRIARHHHIWFETNNNKVYGFTDIGGGKNNIGFGDNGLYDDSINQNKYYPELISIMNDDSISISAIFDNLIPGDYDIFGNNCQDWAKKVVKKYKEIEKEENSFETQKKLEFVRKKFGIDYIKPLTTYKENRP